jgi:hypothetical protein
VIRKRGRENSKPALGGVGNPEKISLTCTIQGCVSGKENNGKADREPPKLPSN